MRTEGFIDKNLPLILMLMFDTRLDLISLNSHKDIVDTKSAWPWCHLQIGSGFCEVFLVPQENGDGKMTDKQVDLDNDDNEFFTFPTASC